MFSATPEFVRRHGGPIAQRILDAVPGWYFDEARRLGLYPNCDIRIHRLYPTDFPAYPGWHCDGEFRETYFSQPDLARIPVSWHLTATASSHAEGVSNTQFLDTPIETTVNIPDGDALPTQTIAGSHTLWGQVHRQVEDLGEYRTWDSRDGELVLFDARTLHRAMPALRRGWRLFFRMSMWHKKNLGEGGKLSKQEQVYKILEGAGW